MRPPLRHIVAGLITWLRRIDRRWFKADLGNLAKIKQKGCYGASKSVGVVSGKQNSRARTEAISPLERIALSDRVCKLRKKVT
jgi:hypothetical protein